MSLYPSAACGVDGAVRSPYNQPMPFDGEHIVISALEWLISMWK
jgi:hypothetical protein